MTPSGELLTVRSVTLHSGETVANNQRLSAAFQEAAEEGLQLRNRIIVRGPRGVVNVYPVFALSPAVEAVQ